MHRYRHSDAPQSRFQSWHKDPPPCSCAAHIAIKAVLWAIVESDADASVSVIRVVRYCQLPLDLNARSRNIRELWNLHPRILVFWATTTSVGDTACIFKALKFDPRGHDVGPRFRSSQDTMRFHGAQTENEQSRCERTAHGASPAHTRKWENGATESGARRNYYSISLRVITVSFIYEYEYGIPAAAQRGDPMGSSAPPNRLGRAGSSLYLIDSIGVSSLSVCLGRSSPRTCCVFCW